MTFDEAIKTLDFQADETLQRFSGNRELMKKFILKFPDDTSVTQFYSAIQEKDYTVIQFAAHTLKGVSGNLGFTELHYQLSELVHAIRSENYPKADLFCVKAAETCQKLVESIRKIDS